jgi:hypothetical protein
MQPLNGTCRAPRQVQVILTDDILVTCGNVALGLLRRHGADVEALTTDKQSVGMFASEYDAVAAIWRHAYGQAS